MTSSFDPVTLAAVLALVALLPLAAILTTSFIKIAVVLMLVRNALGVQQAPPNMALYALALILSAYVMGPVFADIATAFSDAALAPSPEQGGGLGAMVQALANGAEPLKAFMTRQRQPQHQIQCLSKVCGDVDGLHGVIPFCVDRSGVRQHQPLDQPGPAIHHHKQK